MKIEFLDEAQFELDEAIEYYNNEVDGLGDVFLQEVPGFIVNPGFTISSGFLMAALQTGGCNQKQTAPCERTHDIPRFYGFCRHQDQRA